MIDQKIRDRWEAAAKNRSASFQNAGALLTDLLKLMADLRSEGGCPWDREQSVASLRQYVLEEAGEVTEAIESAMFFEQSVRARAGMPGDNPYPPNGIDDEARTETKGLTIAHHPHRSDFDPGASASGAPLPELEPEEKMELDCLYAELTSEIGDLLLQAVFLGDILEAMGYPGVEGSLVAIITKLIRRHPHVYGDVSAQSSADVLVNWEKIKQAERNST
jgi:NTP pyrophosphatase (non-canonical NTP hydrolase)